MPTQITVLVESVCEDHVRALEQVEVDVKLLLILDKQYVHNLLFSGCSDSVNDGFTVVFHL
jgi:hypothetical protein